MEARVAAYWLSARVKQNKNCPYLFCQFVTGVSISCWLTREISWEEIIMKKCGIYIIKNDVNKLVYIGQSVDIVCRWYAHKQAVKNK